VIEERPVVGVRDRRWPGRLPAFGGASAAGAGQRGGPPARLPALATIILDLDRRRVVEVLDGARGRSWSAWLAWLSQEGRAAITVVAMDL
jgi:hypothetical protein